MGFYKYVVTFWDEFDNKKKVGKGLVCAESYAKAAEKLENYYNIIAITGLYALDESDVYDIDFYKDDKYLFKINVEEV